MTTLEPASRDRPTTGKAPGGPARLLRIEGLDKHFGSNHVLRALDLELADNERLVVIGPSGGGKSTLLRCVMGLEEIDAGAIRFAGEPYVEARPGAAAAAPSSTKASSSRSAWCSNTTRCSRICR